MRILPGPRRLPVVGLTLAVLLAIGVAIPVALWSAGAARAGGAGVVTTGFPSGAGEPGIFTDTCERTLTAPNDPILMPGMTGKSMQHDFFGAPAVTASTTTRDLVGGASRCSTSADSSAYWTPVVYQHGTALQPASTLLYWRMRADQSGTTATMPTGLTLIAGDEAADAPQDPAIAAWTCSMSRDALADGVAALRHTATPHDCPVGSDLRIVLTFPDCWDGHSLDGAAQTNAVYDTGGACPADHPVRIPQIVLHVSYPTSLASGLSLSIGPTTRGSTDTEHADFMNGWNAERMSADTAACIDTHTRCGQTSGPLATPRGGRDQPRAAAMRTRTGRSGS